MATEAVISISDAMNVGEQPYRSMEGYVTQRHRDQAIHEFERWIENGEEDVEVVVATRVPVARWRNSTIDCFSSVFIEARYLVDETLCDLVITKVQGPAHEIAVAEINHQLIDYTINTGRILVAGGGNMVLRFPGGLPFIRRPDTALRPLVSSAGDNPIAPRLIVEVEFSNRSMPTAHRFCLQYFELIPQLNAVLLFKFFYPRVDGTFACIAVLYRRSRNGVYIADIVDQVTFGSAPVANQVWNFAGNQVHRNARQLPLVPTPVPLVTPWTRADNPVVRIPASDVFYAALTPGSHRAVRAASSRDIFIDLWQIFYVIHRFWN